MKKIMLSLLTCGCILSVSAQDTMTTTTTTTTVKHKYVYYPSTNVYYDEVSGQYWYQDKGATDWTVAKTLPTTVVVEKTPQYPINYSGNDPWKNNTADIKKYKVKKNGTVKIKTKD